MKDNRLRIAALAALVFVFSLGNSAFASHEGEAKFKGVIESLPNSTGLIGDWRVAGTSVHVTAATTIKQTDGPVAIGAIVKVEGSMRSDGSFDATDIEVTQSGQDDSGDDGAGDDSSQPTFEGTVEILPPTTAFIGDWRVGGRTIHVTASTRIEAEFGPVAVGAFVEVHGTLRADGTMDATKIEVKSNIGGDDGRDDLKGTIESLPSAPGLIGDWKVSGRTVHVTAATIIDQEHGRAMVGASVEVKGTLRADGSIDASKIEVKSLSSGSGDSSEGQRTNVKGEIQSLPSASNLLGDWMIAGRLVHVISSTRLNAEHGAFAVGARVKVKGLQMADGSVVATKIQVKD